MRVEAEINSESRLLIILETVLCERFSRFAMSRIVTAMSSTSRIAIVLRHACAVGYTPHSGRGLNKLWECLCALSDSPVVYSCSEHWQIDALSVVGDGPSQRGYAGVGSPATSDSV